MKPPSFVLSTDEDLLQSLRGMRLLLVDDEVANVLLLEHTLKMHGFTSVLAVTDSRVALSMCQAFAPDLVLLDWMMPHVAGQEILGQLKAQNDEGEFLPVIVLTADTTPLTRRTALSLGAQDFLVKPFDPMEVLLRVQNLLHTRLLYVRQRDLNAQLEARVQERTHELEASQLEVLRRLAQAAEFRDDDTGHHTRRVGKMAALLSEKMGLDPERIKAIHNAAPLHDVGKIGISDTILLKPGKLTVEEFEVVKTHTLIGSKLLRDGVSPDMQAAEIIALSHHEKFDGSGYPHRLRGEDIPLEARILAVVDVFDALTHDRPYKKAWSRQDALNEIQRCSGTHFDPQVVSAFLELQGELIYL